VHEALGEAFLDGPLHRSEARLTVNIFAPELRLEARINTDKSEQPFATFRRFATNVIVKLYVNLVARKVFQIRF